MAFREKRPAMRKFSVILIVAAVVITLLASGEGSGLYTVCAGYV